MNCPRKTAFSWNETEEKEDDYKSVFGYIVSKAYTYLNIHNKFPTWNLVRSWAASKLSFATPLSLTEIDRIYSQIFKWYENIFLTELNKTGLPNVPILLPLGTSIVLSDSIPLLVTSPLMIGDIYEASGKDFSKYTGISLYRDYTSHIRSWIFWKASGILPKKYFRLVLGKESVKLVKINIVEKILTEKIEPLIRHTTLGIQNSVWYQSVSEQCSTCKYFNECRF